MRIRLSVCLMLALISPALAQERSLGDVARASRAQQAQAPKPARVFSNEDSNPQAIKDGEDPLAVFQRASLGFLHDTAHRGQEKNAGNSGPGWRKSATYEVAAADRMRLVGLEGSSRIEWLLVGDAYYSRRNGASWRKLTEAGEIALGQMIFPGALIPQELRFGSQPGDLKSLGEQIFGGTKAVLYRFTSHLSDFDRIVDYWIGKQDSLPRRIEMRTESRSWGTAPIVWTGIGHLQLWSRDQDRSTDVSPLAPAKKMAPLLGPSFKEAIWKDVRKGDAIVRPGGRNGSGGDAESRRCRSCCWSLRPLYCL